MLPEYDMEETASFVSQLGFDGIEWRVRRIRDDQLGKPYSPWGNAKNDLPPERLVKEAEHLRRVCRDAGLAIASLATYVTADDLEEVRILAEGASACGAPSFRVGAPRRYDRTVNYNELYDEAVETYGKALEITRGFGVKVLVEIHGGTIIVSASLAHRLVSNFKPDEIGVIYDTNNMTIEGFETYKMGLELLGPYLAHLHVGNHIPKPGPPQPDGTVNWSWEGASLAEGLSDYPQLMRDLKSVGYEGFISLEDFREMPAEVKLEEGLTYLKAIEASG